MDERKLNTVLLGSSIAKALKRHTVVLNFINIYFLIAFQWSCTTLTVFNKQNDIRIQFAVLGFTCFIWGIAACRYWDPRLKPAVGAEPSAAPRVPFLQQIEQKSEKEFEIPLDSGKLHLMIPEFSRDVSSSEKEMTLQAVGKVVFDDLEVPVVLTKSESNLNHVFFGFNESISLHSLIDSTTNEKVLSLTECWNEYTFESL